MITYIIKPSSPLALKINYRHKLNGKPPPSAGRTKMFSRMFVGESIFIDLKTALPEHLDSVKIARRRMNREHECYFHLIKPRKNGDLLEIARLI